MELVRRARRVAVIRSSDRAFQALTGPKPASPRMGPSFILALLPQGHSLPSSEESRKNDADAQAMVDPELIRILVCPESKQSLEESDADLVRGINVAVAAGAIRNRAGEVVRDPMDGGLVREDGKFLYPVRDGIPIMLIDEAIALSDVP